MLGSALLSQADCVSNSGRQGFRSAASRRLRVQLWRIRKTMARRIKDATLDSRDARSRLKPRGKPYWRAIERGVHLGYRRLKGKAGTWCIRQYVGAQTYHVESICIADDFSDADGVLVLSYWQAIDR